MPTAEPLNFCGGGVGVGTSTGDGARADAAALKLHEIQEIP